MSAENGTVERNTPQSRDAERSVLGSMLRDNTVIGDVLQLLHLDNFHFDAHRKLFDGVRQLYDKAHPVDVVTLAEWLREQKGIERVFIFDFDVHHGNGTQHLFEQRDDVFYASMHRYPFYPGTGAANEIGIEKGRGFTRNIPFPEGAGDPEYLRAVEGEIVRIIDDYRPNAILLSSGFDAHRRDPLGGMRVSESAYGEITRRVVETAQRHAAGRVLSLLEGGYDMEGLAASVDEHVRALA